MQFCKTSLLKEGWRLDGSDSELGATGTGKVVQRWVAVVGGAAIRLRWRLLSFTIRMWFSVLIRSFNYSAWSLVFFLVAIKEPWP